MSNEKYLSISIIKFFYLIAGFISLAFPWMVYYMPSGSKNSYFVMYFNFLGMNEGISEFGFNITFNTYELSIFGSIYLMGFILAFMNVRIDGKEKYRKEGILGSIMMIAGLIGYYITFSIILSQRAQLAYSFAFLFIGFFSAIIAIFLELFELTYSKKLILINLISLPKTQTFLKYCKLCGKRIRLKESGYCKNCEKKSMLRKPQEKPSAINSQKIDFI
ncbi:MAG: hypothetical protein ACTSR8_07135 [Promethearchaeota archaeon]